MVSCAHRRQIGWRDERVLFSKEVRRVRHEGSRIVEAAHRKFTTGKMMFNAYLEEDPSTGLAACLRAPSRDLDALLDLNWCLLLPETAFEFVLEELAAPPGGAVLPFMLNFAMSYRINSCRKSGEEESRPVHTIRVERAFSASQCLFAIPSDLKDRSEAKPKVGCNRTPLRPLVNSEHAGWCVD